MPDLYTAKTNANKPISSVSPTKPETSISEKKLKIINELPVSTNPFSAFALNPYFISPELLYQQGLINQRMLKAVKIPASNITQYERVYNLKDKMLAQATDNWMLTNNLDDYIEENAFFLKPYLTFLSLSRIYDDSCWYNWNEEHKHYSEALYQKTRQLDSSFINIKANIINCLGRNFPF